MTRAVLKAAGFAVLCGIAGAATFVGVFLWVLRRVDEAG